MKNIICPISNERIEENTVRMTGLLVLMMIVISIWLGASVFVAAIALDYYIRAFTERIFSPLTWLARQMVARLSQHMKLIDKSPKIFAARVGFLFAFCGFVLSFTSPLASNILLVILGLFAGLESVFNLCMGCFVYTHLVLRIYK